MPSIAVVEETRSVEVFSLDVVHGTLFSLPIWGLIIWGVVAVINAIKAN
jgi:hypothetical protein